MVFRFPQFQILRSVPGDQTVSVPGPEEDRHPKTAFYLPRTGAVLFFPVLPRTDGSLIRPLLFFVSAASTRITDTYTSIFFPAAFCSISPIYLRSAHDSASYSHICEMTGWGEPVISGEGISFCCKNYIMYWGFTSIIVSYPNQKSVHKLDKNCHLFLCTLSNYIGFQLF